MKLKFKFLLPFVALAFIFAAAVTAQDDPVKGKPDTALTEQVAEVPQLVALERKESFKLDDAEYKSVVATKFSSNYASTGLAGAFLGIVGLFSYLFRALKREFNFKSAIGLGLFALGVTLYFVFPQGSDHALALVAIPFANQIKALREEKGLKVKEMNSLVALSETEKRDFKADEQTKYDALKSDIEGLNARIARLDEAHKRELEEAAAQGSPVTMDTRDISDKEKRDIEKFSFIKVLRAAVNKDRLDGIEGEMAQEARAEMQRAGASPNGIYQIPLVVLRNTKLQREARDMSATTTTAGGHNVATELQGYIEALRETSRVVQLGADYIPGAVGNIDMPRENAVFAPGWTATENANSSESSPTYTKVTFTPKRLAGYIDVSNQLLLQTAPGFENRIKNQMVTGTGEAIDIGSINGAGSSGEPEGILQTSGIGSVVGGTDGAAPDRDDLIDLWTAVANAKGLQGELAYLSNPKVFSKLAKTKTDAGSGLFILDKSKEFMGYNFAVSNNVPSNLVKGASGAVCSAIIFGNFKDLMIVQWGGLEILVDPYTQAVAGLTRMHINSFVDIHVLRPGSFAAMKDALTT